MHSTRLCSVCGVVMEMVGGFGTRWEINSKPGRFGDRPLDLELSCSNNQLGQSETTFIKT